MAGRIFTPSDVEAMIPSLQTLFVEIIQLHAALRREEDALYDLGTAPSAAIVTGNDRDGSPSKMRAKARFRCFFELLQARLAEVTAIGGRVRDLDRGVVDFPSDNKDEHLHWSWTMGASGVQFWDPRVPHPKTGRGRWDAEGKRK